MAERTVYRELAEAIGAGDSILIPRIFEALADEDEARVLLAASPPATIEEIAERTNIPGHDVERMLEPLFKKGLILKSRKEGITRYYRVRHVLQFHDATAIAPDAPRELLDLWKEYTDTEWREDLESWQEALPSPAVRVVPVNVSIEPKTQVLAFEDVRSIIDNARSLAVVNCSCRTIDGKCGKPLEVCIQLNKAADYTLERGTGRKLGKEEAIEILRMCEEEGLVHVTDNRKAQGHIICNCCNDCCVCWPAVTPGLKRFVAPSRFQAQVDAELCTGCEVCLDRCFFGAVSMESDNGTAVIDPEKCMGCGLCAVTCPADAVVLKEVRSAEFLPA